jgi:aminomuconate-semialdehyde/2-hydroxymuconate-6-semialdehyde dehydrogenase
MAGDSRRSELSLMQTIANYINGDLVAPKTGRYLDNFEPATGRVYSPLPDSDAADIDAAVRAAGQAFPVWAALPPVKRSEWLMRIADGIEARLEEFARAESIDTGKPIALARSVDIPRAVANFRFFAGAILHGRDEAHVTDSRTLNYTLRQPRGVAACISPWNLPLYLFSWKVAPALATGNTVVGKPSEVTPMTAHMSCAGRLACRRACSTLCTARARERERRLLGTRTWKLYRSRAAR